MLKTGKFAEIAAVNYLEVGAMYIAASVHDYDHP